MSGALVLRDTTMLSITQLSLSSRAIPTVSISPTDHMIFTCTESQHARIMKSLGKHIVDIGIVLVVMPTMKIVRHRPCLVDIYTLK